LLSLPVPFPALGHEQVTSDNSINPANASTMLLFTTLPRDMSANSFVRVVDVLLCALRSLLVDQVEITDSCFFMGVQLEQYGRGSELVGGSNSIIARIKNVSRPILCELVELE
jgi:hypothetical protein